MPQRVSPIQKTPKLVGQFTTTCWTRVLEAARFDSPEGAEAFAQLYKDYRYPLYAFVRRRGFSPEEAEDIIQVFFEKLIRNQGLDGLQREGGRFRSFLLTALSRLLANEWSKARSQKRGAGAQMVSLQSDDAETRFTAQPPDSALPELSFDRQWAFTLLERVVEVLRHQYERCGKKKIYDTLSPWLLTDPPTLYHDLAAQLGMSEGAVKVALHRLRHRYGKAVREEIGRTVSGPEEVSAELQYLIRVVTS